MTMNHADVMRRLKNDLKDVYSDSIEGIYVYPDEENKFVVHALIVGPEGTPYDKGFFYFVFRFPENYPLVPPSVKLMTTGNGEVRFNPNLYNCGKVCLSILGTWQGPGWTSVMTTKSVLISIRSLMNEKPFFNEPGYEGQEQKYKEESEEYNRHLTHETIRVAVIDMVKSSLEDCGDDQASSATAETSTTTTTESKPPRKKFFSRRYFMPPAMKQMIVRLFYQNFSFYQSVIEKNINIDDKKVETKRLAMFMVGKQKFMYKELLERLKNVRKSISIEENMAEELYDSLRSCYCPPTVRIDSEEEQEMTDLFNECD